MNNPIDVLKTIMCVMIPEDPCTLIIQYYEFNDRFDVTRQLFLEYQPRDLKLCPTLNIDDIDFIIYYQTFAMAVYDFEFSVQVL